MTSPYLDTTGGNIRTNSTIVPMLDGDAYFADLKYEIDRLATQPGVRGVYLANWSLGDFDDQFQFAGTGQNLFDYLEGVATGSGVDVRLMLWAGSMIAWSTNDNHKFISKANNTEGYPGLKNKCIGNVLVKKATASAHLKIAVLFCDTYSIAYVGGLDLKKNRVSDQVHHSLEIGTYNLSYRDQYWHDVQAKAYGEVVQDVYDFYKDTWNSNITYSADLKVKAVEEEEEVDPIVYLIPEAAEYLPERTLAFAFTPVPTGASSSMYTATNYSTTTALHECQFSRTIPSGTDFMSGTSPSGDECSGDSHPNGIAEVLSGLKTAIAAATTYIYIEDQGMYSSLLFEELRTRLNNQSALKLVLVVGLLDGPAPMDVMREQAAIPVYLLDGLNNPGQVALIYHRTAITHSKVWLIDDAYAIVGTANMMNRSMQKLDTECSIAFVDSGSTTTVKEFRQALWAEHLHVTTAQKSSHVDDLTTALGIWFGTSSTFKLARFATSVTELFGGNEDYDTGIETPASARVLVVFQRGENEDGSISFDNSSSVEVESVEQDGGMEPDLIFTDDGTVGTIVDSALMSANDLGNYIEYPDSSFDDLTGCYVYFQTEEFGGFISQIVSHDSSSGTITFSTVDIPAYSRGSVVYTIIQPFVDSIDFTAFTWSVGGRLLLWKFD